MKKSTDAILKSIAILGVGLTVACAQAQTTTVPKQLTGKWATPDSRDGQRVIVEMNAAKRIGALSLSFADPRCTVQAAPMSLATLGGRLTLKMIEGYSNPCVSDVTLELVPNRGPKGDDGYLGELRLTGSAANRAPILRGRLTQP